MGQRSHRKTMRHVEGALSAALEWSGGMHPPGGFRETLR